MVSGRFGLIQGTEETQLATDIDYNKFLDDILGEKGLAHGYHVFMEKSMYSSHVIFTKDSKKRNLLKRMFNEEFRGQLFSVHEVAKFIEEPWFNYLFGCSPIDNQVAKIKTIDPKYFAETSDIRRQIGEYSKSINPKRCSFPSLVPKNRILSIK
ncbi:MAG: hypothetical protein AABW47_01690 [Nanoarchaeota archaeon]